MEDNIIIYVAGNPDAYPLEYYDSRTESYQGVIPQLLEQFSQQSGYEIRYYPSQASDQRAHLGQNRQVDILSGYTEGEDLPREGETLSLFQTEYQGESVSYYLSLTPAAPDDLKGELEHFLEGVSQAEISGMLMSVSKPSQQHMGFYWAIGGLAFALTALACILVCVVRHYRHRLKQSEQGLETNPITGLGNFDYLQKYYRQLVNDQNRILYSAVYFYVDTEGLRRLGTSLEQNEFLRYCAVVLQEHTGDTDMLAQVSDHGFVVLKFSETMEQVQDWIAPVFQRLHTYPQTYGKQLEVSVTAGIYPLKREDRDLNDILFQASQGAYDAHRNQRDYCCCSGELLQKLAQERQVQSRIDQALERQEMELFIQFYVDVENRQIVGGEALSRWRHPEKGLLKPGAFVPLLEQDGLIYKLDYYCLRECCEFLQQLVECGVEDFFISCNFSRETFEAEDFAQKSIEIMQEYQFPRELLIFELTESALAHQLEQIRSNMHTLKAYGVSIILDDFGEGFTSFADLQQYPVDGIKLDKGLVDNIQTENGIAILRAMVQVGHDLGITILAEGVEDDDQVQALRQIHCDVIQGYQFYLPMPQNEAKDKILEQFCGVGEL